MLGLRLREGLDLDALALKYGPLAAETVEAGAAEGLRRGWVELVVESDQEKASTNMVVKGGQHDEGKRAVERSIRGPRSDRVYRGGERTMGDFIGGNVDGSKGEGLIEGALTTDVDTDHERGVVAGGAGGGVTVGRVKRLRLSDPDGFLFSNSVISSVFCKLDQLHASGRRQSRSSAPPAAAVAAGVEGR